MHPNQPPQPAPEPSGESPTAEPTTAYPVVPQPGYGQPGPDEPGSAPSDTGQRPAGPSAPDESSGPAQRPSGHQTHPPTVVQPVVGQVGAPGPAAPYQGGAPAFGAATAGPSPRPGVWLSLGDALAGGGALLVFLFSFAPFVGYDDADLVERLEEENLPTWFSAWALETFLAPLSWWVIFSALGLVAIAGLRFLLPRDREFAGFRFGHVQVGLSFFAFFVLLGYALSAKTLLFGAELQDESSGVEGDVSLSWGGYLMLVGALVAAVGAVIDHLGLGPTVWPTPPRPAYPGQPHPGHPAHSQGYPQSHPGYPQAQPGHPQPGYPPGQATVPRAAQHGGYPPPSP